MLSRRPMLQNIRTGDRLAINLNTAEIGIVWRLNNSAALGIIPRSAAALFLCGVINVSVNPDVLPGWLLLGGGGAAGGVAFIWWAARRMDTARKAHRLFFRVVFTCYELPPLYLVISTAGLPLLAHPYLPKLRQSVEYASGCETCAFGETATRLLAFALPLSLALSLLPARCCLKKLR